MHGVSKNLPGFYQNDFISKNSTTMMSLVIYGNTDYRVFTLEMKN